MTRFELQISGVRSNPSTNCATTTAQDLGLFPNYFELLPPEVSCSVSVSIEYRFSLFGVCLLSLSL